VTSRHARETNRYRELKSTLSECVRQVKAGRSVVVTEHGQPVARIIPEGISARARVEAQRGARLSSRDEPDARNDPSPMSGA
jgi:antitoxin (DNA-binding transcriptional repressor) of toxin-antitoxin stability system